MEDANILDLYFARKEDAIKETDAAYGRRLYVLANNIVQIHEDAEESVSDTYWKAWESIPPQRPQYFFAYLAKICRNFALGKLDWKNAAKRKAEIVTLSQEMEQCIPDKGHTLDPQSKELNKLLNRFLGELSQESRTIFMRRYWYMDTVAEIAQRCHVSESKVKSQLYRTRSRLKNYLEQEGIAV